MKRVHFFFTVFFILLFACAALAATSPPQFTVTLAAPEHSLKAGSALLLRLTVTNTSDHATRFPSTRGIADVRVIYKFHIFDELGRPVPRRVLPCERPPSVCGGSAQSKLLQPGESFTEEIDITSLYDLSRPGKYNIWVSEPYFRGSGPPNGLVTSNSVKVTVVK